MKRSLMWCALGVVLLAGMAWAQAGDAEKAVAAQEQKWLESQKTNNVELLVPLLHEKFIDTSSEGKVTNKSQTLAEAKATKWTSAEYTDVKVTVFGDAAVATGGFNGKGTDPSGKAIDVHERWTDTWVKTPKGWQCVATQATPVK
jgi:ketosteroid isomerase-like protein